MSRSRRGLIRSCVILYRRARTEFLFQSLRAEIFQAILKIVTHDRITLRACQTARRQRPRQRSNRLTAVCMRLRVRTAMWSHHVVSSQHGASPHTPSCGPTDAGSREAHRLLGRCSLMVAHQGGQRLSAPILLGDAVQNPSSHYHSDSLNSVYWLGSNRIVFLRR